MRSLRGRVTTFYVGLLAIALIVSSATVYLSVRTFLTRTRERTISRTAVNVLRDFVVRRDTMGDAWFLEEMSKAYPAENSDRFVRVSSGGRVLYDSGDMRDPYVSTRSLSLPTDAAVNRIRRETARSGQRLIIDTIPYRAKDGSLILVEAASTLEPVKYVIRSLALGFLLTVPVVLLAAALGGYLVMSRALRPVSRLTEQAERVGRKHLGERLAVIETGDELERLSTSLNRMIERLEEALAHNQRFSADASHELRTPLTIVRGELEELEQMDDLPEEALDGVGSALEEIDRMSQIVNSLMTISRLDSGSERMKMAAVDLNAIAWVTVDHMHLMAEEQGITLKCATGEPVYVRGDEMRLKQVMVNLLDNAMKYTPAGGSAVVAVTQMGPEAVLRVSDTGIGISACSLPFVFDRFYRADEARSRESGGMGLGLSIVKSICSAHDGVVSIQSTDGEGTTLTVRLPLSAEGEAGAGRAQRGVSGVSPAADRGSDVERSDLTGSRR